MENQKFYLKISGALLSIITASTALILNHSMKGLIAAVLTATAAALIKNAEKTSRKKGRTKQMKTSLKASKDGGELLILSAALISYPAGTAAAAAVIGLVAFYGTVSKSVREKEGLLGQEIRVGLLIAAFLGLLVNQYLLFYGLLAVGLVAGFDSVYILYRSFETGF
ncbi:MAG: hypothetical protein BRC26_04315 [Nanohaloarchaea archaeon QH_8_44_6]|nr:MAG: hypothetical protein BRC26_04315 [Nanohaloarchaea archaeon QH_8_44_6]